MQIPELWLAAGQRNGKVLESVPEALLTAEIYLAAVQQDGNAPPCPSPYFCL
ncbi:MAG: hypothetical protein LBB61_09295 [Treponema sp.]|nr:hypothetical protein [Treponema sp.]